MATLPGDKTTTQITEEAIRVNHAGEYGAKRIYEGQLAVLKNDPAAKTIQTMLNQELVHLDYFEKEITKRNVRPTLLHPVWHVAGYMLGATSALLGKEAAMACTVAVEEVIDAHYQEQIDQLPDEEKALKKKIIQFQKEECEHRDIGLAEHAEDAPAYSVLTSLIKAGSRAAIFLSKRI